MKKVLEIENLSYKKIFKNLNLDLKEKTFYILIGKNSSGKSTLVNAILGNIKFSGNIKFNEIDNKNIGVITDYSCLLKKTPFDSLMFFLSNLGYEDGNSKKIIYDICNKFELNDILFKDTKTLTSSQKKMFLLILTIVHNPKLIIIDDTLEELDYKFKNMYFEFIKEMKETTILFITNDSRFFYLADTLLFVKDNKIIEEQSKKERYNDEKTFIKCNSDIPFIYNLSSKLCVYDIIKKPCTSYSELVNKIWK